MSTAKLAPAPTPPVEAQPEQKVIAPPSPEIVPQKVHIDPDTAFDDEFEGLTAEKKALNFINENHDNILPTKEYIEKSMLKILLQALTLAAKERPDNPIEFVAYYMLKHNPKRLSKE